MTRPYLELVAGYEQTDDALSTWSLQGLPTLGRYELVYELGRGSNGVVYEACDTHLDRSVALKVFNTHTPRDRVYAEATALAQVVHPNVLALHDLRFEAGAAYLGVLELVAARVGTDVGDVAETLLAMGAQRRYLLLGTLGETRRATVFAAVDQLLAREVAVKVLHDTDDGERRGKLLAEVQALTRFDHPHIVRAHDFGVHDDRPYIAMELCDTDLEAWAPDRRWPSVIDRLLEAGRGLEAVHAAGYVHGDIKPENILIAGGVAKLGDFGLAAEPGWAPSVSGTAGYIGPEVAEGHRFEASDVFAFASTAWFSLFARPAFGEPPPTAGRPAATLVLLERARDGMIDDGGARGRELPMVVIALRRALHPEPGYRPELGELLEDLAAARSTGAVGRWVASWSLARSAARRRRGQS